MSDFEKTSDQSLQPNDPPIEVTPRKGRRVFAAEYKRRLLEELDRAEHGQAAHILRREGLYAATVAYWRKQRDRGLKSGKRVRSPIRTAHCDVRMRNSSSVSNAWRNGSSRPRRSSRYKKSLGDTDQTLRNDAERRGELLMETRRLAEVVGVARACEALAIPRSSYYYAMRQERLAAECADQEILCEPSPPSKESVVSPRRLSPQEVEHILAIVVSDRFSDMSVAAIYYTLLDEGIYLASQSTIGRLLRRRGLSGDRRLQRRHESHSRPELVASAPNQV